MRRRTAGRADKYGVGGYSRRTPQELAQKCVAPWIGSASTSRGTSWSHAESSAMKVRALRRISWPRNRSPPEDMTKEKKCNLAGSRLDACPTVAPTIVGMSLTVEGRGTKGEGRVLAMARVYTRMYEFRPHSEVITALRLRCWKYALEAIINWLLLYFLVHDNRLLSML